MMLSNTVLYYKSKFGKFRNISSSRIDSIPADNNDDFAFLMCTTENGTIGFDANHESQATIKTLISKCYFLDMNGRIQPPLTKSTSYMPQFLFRDKDGEFKKLLAEHNEYEIKLKRFNIISKYRQTEKPKPSILNSFLKNKEHSISRDLYRALTSACHYTAIAKLSGEYGFGALDIFSKNIDFIFSELDQILGGSGQTKEVETASKMLNH